MIQRKAVPLGIFDNVRPVGKVSVIVIVPLVSTLPILLGVIVKVPSDDPAPKLSGACVLAIVKSGAAPEFSGNKLAADSVLVPVKSRLSISDVVAAGLLATPPVVPAVVVPFVVPVGCAA